MKQWNIELTYRIGFSVTGIIAEELERKKILWI